MNRQIRTWCLAALLAGLPAAGLAADGTGVGNGDGRPVQQSALEDTVGPMLLETAEPEYPDIAKAWRMEGRVIVQCLIGTDGLVKQTEISVSSGYWTLDTAALRCARQWKFRPAMSAGKSVEVIARIPITFRLH